MKDHLGNTRVVIDETGAIVQERRYYQAVYPDAIGGMVRPCANPLACT